MAKDTYWFPHDYEPTSDPKIIALIGEHGATGYGIYWRVVEMLHSAESHKLPKKLYIYTAIAKQMKAEVKQIQAVLEFASTVCELFSEDEDFFWANRVYRNIERKDESRLIKISAGRSGGLKSAESRKNKLSASSTAQALLKQTSSTAQADSSIEKRREEKKEDNNIIVAKKIPPEKDAVLKYFEENKPAHWNSEHCKKEADSFFDYHQTKGWMVSRAKMKDWQAAVRTWIRNDYGFSKNGKLFHKQSDQMDPATGKKYDVIA